MPINVHFSTTDRSGITRDSALVEGIHEAIFALAVDHKAITQKRAASLLHKLENARTAGQLAAVGKTVAALFAPYETKATVIYRNPRRRVPRRRNSMGANAMYDALQKKRIPWAQMSRAQIEAVIQDAAQHGDAALVRRARAALARR